MPPKLRKDKPIQGSKSTPTNTTNKFTILSEETNTTPAKSPPEVAPDTTTTLLPTSESQLATMQNNIASTAQIIMTLSSSIHKMDKGDKIDVIEARQ